MRIARLWIDGYGRFASQSVTLTPGLQIILGPNEQGKTTLRHFISDMLYGQKRNASPTDYDESHELRRPWRHPERYSGRLTYLLDNGFEIEVHRSFNSEQDAVHVFNRTHGREITEEFERYRNNEPNFAERHLGLTKAVFTNTATIGHLTLEHLGDEDALEQIRERILCLADSSEDSASADTAQQRLLERILAIGRPSVETSKPLPIALARREELERERAESLKSHEAITELERERTGLREEIASLNRRRAQCEDELHSIESRDRLQRFIEVQRIQIRIDDVTQKCFALSSVREFPLEHTPEVQRAANGVATARAQVERTRVELDDLQRQLQTEMERFGGADSPASNDVPEHTERELGDLEARITRLTERLEALEEERTKAEQRSAQAQRDLELAPDFSTIDTDPVEWLSQLAMSFRLAVQSRDNEMEKLRRLRESVDKRQSVAVKPGWVFSRFEDFHAEAREYEVQLRVHREQTAALQASLERSRTLAQRKDVSAPGFMWGAGILTLFSAGFFIASAYFEKPYLYIPAILCTILLIASIAAWIQGRIAARRAHMEVLEIQDDLLRLDEETEERRERIDKAIAEAGVASLRELDALYEQYTRTSAELKALRETMSQQEQLAEEGDERVRDLFVKVKETFEKFGETVADEDDIQNAVNRTIARYQEWRDAKRRLSESKDRPAQLEAQCEKVRQELEECRREEVSRALDVRQTMRDSGFREESKYTSALSALRAYRIRSADLRQKRGRIDVLKERAASLEWRLEAELKDQAKQEEGLARRLALGGADSIEHWHELAKQAKQYRDAWEERSRLQEKLDSLLMGESLEALRKAVEKDGPAVESFRRLPTVVKEELESLRTALAARSKQEHDLQLEIAKRTAGQRSLSEIDEDLAVVQARIERMELELEAGAYAAALIEEVARDRHSRIAPRMATLAGAYLREITGGAYNELVIGRDLRISVRIPQTKKLSENPRNGLSKGTVDQIYLALRLALVKSLSDSGESIPLLLDDPFANYDDDRLSKALNVLRRIGETNQILLFTCRHDVAEAATVSGVPILTL
ncbi:MAG: AAA family ATPase [Candidatus Hydrogenedentes bacterium]|nr:AAA family ATPase [Candidatus Hydrogenedentota bacterium]